MFGIVSVKSTGSIELISQVLFPVTIRFKNLDLIHEGAPRLSSYKYFDALISNMCICINYDNFKCLHLDIFN